ncbi:hypothetical protein [Lentibacillus sediminis]|uniref:hypothetical protein n=1 Tax=Lentibacillus sediminis TaxID=1940529 RepID=UPI000C1BC3D2|nr:hypothetical protein [Lentibacillus sediminis]
MNRAISLLMILIMLLAACNGSQGSYAIIVTYNNIEYSGSEESINDYEIDMKIGQVREKVKASSNPKNNQSNFFEEGSVIYSVKNETDFIIVENTNGDKYLLKKNPLQKNRGLDN